MSDGKVVIDTGLDTKEFEAGVSKMKSLASAGAHAVVKAFAVVGTAVSGAGVAAIKVGSDFEAGMSKVAAISGATGNDLQALNDKAKQMGADTKFSATEAASALQYMAMAGWDTHAMLNGIDGIMNLAAADGLDLATTSDIVTDAITAFGLSASDSGHFADVLATASSSANTNVAMLGESFKYVGPIAGAMKYSVEDVSQALGLMANASVKGSMAGTSLKTALANMAAPTDAMAEIMEQYGISLTNTDGSMKSLGEVIQNLRTNMGGLDEATQTAAASTLFGKEAMAGMLAVINASEADYTKLSDAINNADGTAERMADTMQDNLQGSLAILGSSLEGLGIQIYESMEEPLKEAAQTGIKSVERLSDAFKSGGIKGAVRECSIMFDELVNSVSDTDSKLSGIIKPLINVGREVMNIGKNILPPFAKTIEYTADNLDILIPILVSSVTAIKGYEALKSATEMFHVLSKRIALTSKALANYEIQQIASTYTGRTYNESLTISQAMIGLLTGKLKIATVAQTAWNTAMSVNPIAFVIAGIAALTAGMIAYNATHESESEALIRSAEERTKSVEKLKDEAEAWEEVKNARNKAIESGEGEINHTQELWNELQTIVDANGRIKQGYEDRAGFITGVLANAFGIEINTVDGVIQKYDELSLSIQEMIEQKRAELVLQSQEESYQQALTNRVSKYNEIQDAERSLAKTKKELEQAEAELTSAYSNGGVAQVNSAKAAVKQIQGEYDKQDKAIGQAKSQYEEYQLTIARYEGLGAAIASKDSSKIAEAVNNITFNFKTAGTATKGELEKQVSDMKSYTLELRSALEEGMPGVTEQMVSEAEQMTIRSIAELDKFGQNAAISMINGGTQAKDGLASTIPSINETAGLMASGANLMFKSVDQTDAGIKGGTEYGLGIYSTKAQNDKTAQDQAQSTNANLKSVNQTDAGANAGQQYAIGLDGKKYLVNSTAALVSATANTGLGTTNTSGTGANAGSQYASGISSQSTNANAAGASVSSSANSGLESQDTYSSGSYFSQGFIKGIWSMVGNAVEAARSLASSAVEALRKRLDEHSPSRVTRKIGAFGGEGFALGFEDETKRVEGASMKLTKAALKGIDVSAMASKMKNTVNTESAKIGAAISSTVKYKISDEREETQRSQEQLSKMLASYLVQGIKNSGIAMVVDGVEIARLGEGVFI